MNIITKPTPRNNQNKWSFGLSSIFLALLVGGAYVLWTGEKIIEQLTPFDTFIIVLAVFRATRLFVYDNVTRFIRDFFIIKEEVKNELGNVIVIRRKYSDGFRKNISDLLSCPWCLGVWLSFFITFFYLWTPYAWFPIFVLAVAGLSSLIQITINLIGWRAEQLKGIVEHDDDTDNPSFLDEDFSNRS